MSTSPPTATTEPARAGATSSGVSALAEICAAIRPADPEAMQAARTRLDALAKPPGSLGRLEDLAVQLAGISGQCPPAVPTRCLVTVFAADHGVHAQGVSPWPQEITAAMVGALSGGGAAVTVLSRANGAEVLVVDVGVATPLPVVPDDGRFRDERVRAGTADLTREPAMIRQEAEQALMVGARMAQWAISQGVDCLLTGDMGIANTTASAALIAAFTGADAAAVTGRGTGIDDQTWAHKVEVVRAGLGRHREVIAGRDPIAILAAIGGLEHAAIAGYILAGAAARVPVILDGVIAGAAALVAQAMAGPAIEACIAGHRSAEPGHAIALAALELSPLLDLNLRLGEGTGAVLALPLVRSAAVMIGEMATLADL